MASRVVGLARAARGYLPGFGTSGSLLAGAVLMFVLASALVAFRGWPHVAAQPSPGEVVVSPSPTAATGSSSSRRLALFVATPAAGAGAGAGAGAVPGATGGAPGGGRSGRAGRQRSIGRPVSTTIPTGSSGAGAGSTNSCAAGGCGSTVAPAPAPVGSGSVPTQPVQPVIRQTTGALGGAISATGKQVGSVVKRTTGAVSGAAGQVSPAVGGAVNSIGSGAAQTVTGVSQTIAGALSGSTDH